MAIGFGPGTEMQKDYQRNSTLLGKRKSLKEISTGYADIHPHNAPYYDEQAWEEFKMMKLNLRLQKEKEKIKKFFVFASLVAIVSFLVVFVLN